MFDLFAAGQDLSLPEAAVKYAAAGIPVFPCVPGEKKPLIRRGFQAATTDLRTVAKWWSRWPNANLGIPTGRSGFDVVDIDCHPSGSGFAAMERARRAGLTDGWAAIVRTPSQGVHYYYPTEPGHPQPSWSEGTVHIDFRGTGGYILAPPSQVTGEDGATRRYQLIAQGREGSPVDGQALRTFLHPRPKPKPSTSYGQESPAASERGIANWLATRNEGTRNHSLFWAASRYAEHSIPEPEALDVLGEVAERIGLDRPEIVTTIRSAYRRTNAARPPGKHASVVDTDADPLFDEEGIHSLEEGPLAGVDWERARDALERRVEELAGRGIVRAAAVGSSRAHDQTRSPGEPHSRAMDRVDAGHSASIAPATTFGSQRSDQPQPKFGR